MMDPVSLKTLSILVTPTSYGQSDPKLIGELKRLFGEVVFNPTGKPLSSAELVKLIPGKDGYIAGLDIIDRKVIEAADRLKVIARYGVGVDAIDLHAALEKGITVTNTPGANSVSVAELTIGLLLSLARNITMGSQSTRAGQWKRMAGISLEGKTIGIIGFGTVGKQVAQRLRGFDCTLLVFDPVLSERETQKSGVTAVPLDQLKSESDFITLHCPLTDDTKEMINSEFIAGMKKGSYLINTARGELVDEKALYEALVQGILRGAALDVFTQEPPDRNNPLLSLEQVIATPHMASHTDGSTNAMGWGALKNCLAVLQGEEPPNRVI